MRNKTIYIKVLLLAAFSFTAEAKMNVGSSGNTQNNGGKVAAGCRATSAQEDLKVNNVRARILNGGDLWWDPVGQIPYYEVPIGSNKNSIYSGGLWIAGIDNNNAIKAACMTYRQGGNDFWAGPINKDPNLGLISTNEAQCDQYDRVWKIAKKDVEDFVATGEATNTIKDWPAHGNVALGQLYNLAPFFDANADGTYNYADGDYPYYNLSGDYPIDPSIGGTVCNDYLFGDETIWWVFNDVGNTHTETESDNPIGLEIRAQAFAFNTADDINNMTFYKYQIINRSNDALNQTYFGVWCDPDLGNASDDYVGCDVGLGLGYVYNADAEDEGGGGYGFNPPAVGIDFFQGPLADPNDGIDNDKDGTPDEPGEQIIMSKFLYYINENDPPNGNPGALDDYYQYLSGKWKDGLPVTYGGDGRTGSVACNYMFPGTTDPDFTQNWTMGNSGIQPADMRWLQSVGLFTLQPGAVNYITTGVVWAKASAGGPGASVTLMKLADKKAQALFDNCFKVLDGPNAPDLAIRELDKKVIINLVNTKNDKVEYYSQIDPTIPDVYLDSLGDSILIPSEARKYKFQGYRLYQLANKNVSVQELADPGKAKLIRQIDLKDTITQLVNMSYDNILNVWFPMQMSDNSTQTNLGLYHTIEITTDEFTGQNLVNFQPYYYMAVSYANNSYRPFNPFDAAFTQSTPYKQGRLNVKVYSAIPHKPFYINGGTAPSVSQGQAFDVRRIEGQGNGGNALDFTAETVNEILTSPDHRALHPVYQAGHGPINPTVIDPYLVKAGDLKLMFSSLAPTANWGIMNRTTPVVSINNIIIKDDVTVKDVDTVEITTNGSISVEEGRFVRLDQVQGVVFPSGINQNFFQVYKVIAQDRFSILVNGASGLYVAGTGTAEAAVDRSTLPISIRNAQIMEDFGTSLDIINDTTLELGGKIGNNGFLEATITENSWLNFLADNDAGANSGTAVDWIRPAAENAMYESILGGTWAPAKFASQDPVYGVLPNLPQPYLSFLLNSYVNSIDVVFTSDRSKWTRCIVLEMAPGSQRFNVKNRHSVDQNGDSTTTAADSVSAKGMSWFPGYAVNLETGERLNMAFGENSLLPEENGNDMVWNPTATVTNANDAFVFGGMHYIYVFGHNKDGVDDVPRYDYGRHLITKLGNNPTTQVKRNVLKDIMWTSVPLARFGVNLSDGNPQSDVKVRLRMYKGFRQFASYGESTITNSKNPYYEFNIPASAEPAVVAGQASEALKAANVVPNPYYGYSRYERTREDQLDTRIRITNIPSKCTISIYTLNGTLVRQLKRSVQDDVSEGMVVEGGRDENLASFIDWDLKNTAGVAISSGVYYIHIDAGDLGEKVIKWLGVMRPIDLDSF